MADMHVTKINKWTEKEDEIIRLYYPKGGIKEVSKRIPNRTKDAIHYRAKKLKVSYLSYNKDFFENIDTEEKAYWLGFMYTDGYVTTNNRWGLSLSTKDEDHIRKFLQAFNCNVNIKRRQRKENFGYDNGAVYGESSFLINNAKMYKDLTGKGVVRNKTESLTFPSSEIVRKDLLPHFIRGLFDGDGSFTIFSFDKLREDRNNKIYHTTKKEISFVCKSERFVDSLIETIENECHFNVKKAYSKRDDLFYIRIMDSKLLVKFIDYLFNNSTVHLDRKYIKAMEIKQYCLS